MIARCILPYRKALTFSGALLVITLSLTPMFYRTWAFSSDAWGLTTVALIDPDEMPWSPQDMNSMAIRPAVAFWILMNTDWPYERCGKAMTAMGGCSQPLVSMVGASLDMLEPEFLKERGFALLRHFVERGEPINAYYNGFAPVHEAVLYADIDYLRALIELGADLNLLIERPDKEYYRFNALEFARFLERRDVARYGGIATALESGGWFD